mgnify:CR=1 FL=1
MRKEDAILKINKLGNVGNIVVRIMKIIAIIGFVLTLVGAIAVMVLPKNLIKLDLGATADITVDVTGMVSSLDEAGKEAMLQGFFDGLDEEDAGVSMNLNGSEYETVSAETGPTGSSAGSSRVSRGGSWGNYAYDASVCYRISGSPSNRGSNLGFRVVRQAN